MNGPPPDSDEEPGRSDEKPVPLWVLLLLSCLGVKGAAVAIAYIRRTARNTDEPS